MKSYRRRDFHNYKIQFYANQDADSTSIIDVLATTIEDAVKSFNEKIADMFPSSYATEIISIDCDGRAVPQELVDAMNASYLDECDGAACGDVGGTAAAGGDAPSGISSGEVLGAHDHNNYDGGFFGTDCFHIPAKAKVPFHRWEICNGGSKRKKTKNGKDKKYAYEKGMKVVVDMFESEQLLNEYEAPTSYEKLHGADWEDVKAEAIAKAERKMRSKAPYTVDQIAIKEMVKNLQYRWQAAQLPPPDVAQHGDIGACSIDEDKFKREYLKEYFVHGWYKDGTMLEIGPISRQVASAYISLHKLSLNSKAFQAMKDSNFSGIHKAGNYINGDKLTIIKTNEGHWLYSNANRFKAGPFANKQLARMYAAANGYKLETKSPNDKVKDDGPTYLKYPTFAFSYTMAGVPCADIVVAEDLSKAMKLFDFQWRVFDGTRPIKQVFNSIEDLQRDLSLLRIKDIEIEQLDADNVDEYVELANEIGNPSTIASLKSRCRNPRFKYILGRDQKTGRSLVTIEW